MTASSVLASCHKKFVGFLRWVLPARRERPRGRRTADKRHELASFQLIELHSVPSQGRIADWTTKSSLEQRSI